MKRLVKEYICIALDTDKRVMMAIEKGWGSVKGSVGTSVIVSKLIIKIHVVKPQTINNKIKN